MFTFFSTRGQRILLFLFCTACASINEFVLSLVVKDDKDIANLRDIFYIEYPRRTEDEAAVLEWGHSAIISALDASVATFGPQTSQAALLEVECMPVLALPLNGIFDEYDDDESVVRPLLNADEVHGNMVVMTNTGDITGLELARIARLSGAAALLLVNIDEERPDDIYRLSTNEGESSDDIDIPVVMISMNSANVLTSATAANDMDPSEVVNHGMPERVRLYAGGDRPFFEDVEPIDPTLYLIHNLLTKQECDDLIKAAQNKLSLVTGEDPLQMTNDANKFTEIHRVMLWQGMLQSQPWKQIEERIEQVTGFPMAHFSDFVVDRFEPDSYWNPHYDTNGEGMEPPIATINIFLTEGSGPMVYPRAKDPVKIIGRKGLAVVHHNTNERQRLDRNVLHAMFPPEVGPVYVARKYVFTNPETTVRRLVLPMIAAPFGGKLPFVVVTVYNTLVSAYGQEQGSFYFEKLCTFIPCLIFLGIAQFISQYVQKKIFADKESELSANASKNDKKKKS